MLHRFTTLCRVSAIALMLGAPTFLAFPESAGAQVAISVSVPIAPPALPIYAQPPLPALGYLWTPGYWAWDGSDYYWVPGVWVRPPRVGFLWTPGYWGWNNGAYLFNEGYWGLQVGFYGGINYGFGYGGFGFEGGYWRNGGFYYNRAANNFGGVHVTNVYNHNVTVNGNNNHVSFNGGHGGTEAKPSAAEQAAARQTHVPRTAEQTQHQDAAAKTPGNHFTNNKGVPAVAATSHPGDLKGPDAVPATAAGKSVEEPKSAGAAEAKSKEAPKSETARTHHVRPRVAAHPHNVRPRVAAHPHRQTMRPHAAHPRTQHRNAPSSHGHGGGGHCGNKKRC